MAESGQNVAVATNADRDQWGDHIVELRKEKGISQRTLARQLDINRNMLRRMEREGHGDIADFARVFAFLGYELDLHLVPA